MVQKGGRFLSGLWVIPGPGSRECITDIPAYYHKLRNFGSLEMVHHRINAHGGFTPAAMAPPNAIDPERVLRHPRSARGRHEGTGTVTSFIIPVLRISYHSKNVSTDPKLHPNLNRIATVNFKR